MRSVPGAVATGYNPRDARNRQDHDPVATPGTDAIIMARTRSTVTCTVRLMLTASSSCAVSHQLHSKLIGLESSCLIRHLALESPAPISIIILQLDEEEI